MPQFRVARLLSDRSSAGYPPLDSMVNLEESAPAPVRQVPIDQPARYAYRPALDGVRAIAVVAVLLYHGRVGWAQGGYLGVDLFFVLSGYLITTLLVTEFSGTSGIALTQFWLRRARRLLPALFVVLVGCALYSVFLVDASQVAKIRGDAIASLLYVANWHFIFSGASYFDQFTLPSPLRHMWSLAIEEQFYLVWPLVILGGLRLVGRTRRHWRTLWIAALAAGTVGFPLPLWPSCTATGRTRHQPTTARSLGPRRCSSGRRWRSC